MVNNNSISEIIELYKEDIKNRTIEERYKWEAIRCFQDNWDIDAKDFVEVFNKSFEKSNNLLASRNFFPKLMLSFYVQYDPEFVRGMFKELFNEDLDLLKRVVNFQESSDILTRRYSNPKKEKLDAHYQKDNVITIYLFFRYPDKYYMYQYGKFRSFVNRVNYPIEVRRGDLNNISKFMQVCDEVLKYVIQDRELITLHKSRLDNNCYLDSELHMLTDDIVYFGGKVLEKKNKSNTTLDVDDPEDLIIEESLTYDKNIILYGPPGTGKTYHSINYAVGIIENKSIDLIKKEEYKDVLNRFNSYKKSNQIVFTTFHQSFGYEDFIEGIQANVVENGIGEKTLNYEIKSGIFKEFCERAKNPNYDDVKEFGFNENPIIWKVSLAGTYENEVRKECLKNNHIRIGWDKYGPNITEETNFLYGGKIVLNAFINQMQIGDIVLSCYSEKEIDAIGVISGEYEWSEKYNDYHRVRKVNWIVKDIKYNILSMNKNTVMTLATVYKLNISLNSVLSIISDVKKLKEKFENKRRYVFIIDEINRGNISKIFGELITLIESSKREGMLEEMKTILPYSKEEFGVPNNVYIIGTMNTADRSIAFIDTALRRRFTFIEKLPDLDVLDDIKVDGIDISLLLERLNQRIEVLCDREHVIGHAYFLSLKDEPTIENLAKIFEYNIIPLLQEYFYDDFEKIRLALSDSKNPEDGQFIKKVTNDYNNLFIEGFEEIEERNTYKVNKNAFYNINSYQNII